jgi:hypothetical protein
MSSEKNVPLKQYHSRLRIWPLFSFCLLEQQFDLPGIKLTSPSLTVSTRILADFPFFSGRNEFTGLAPGKKYR